MKQPVGSWVSLSAIMTLGRSCKAAACRSPFHSIDLSNRMIAALLAAAAFLLLPSFVLLAVLSSWTGCTNPSSKSAWPVIAHAAFSGHSGRTLQVYEQQVSYFDECNVTHQPEVIEDWTPLLKDLLDLHAACVLNPSIIHLPSLGNGLMLLSVRFYLSWHKGTPCTSGELKGGQWNEVWKGRGGFALVVVRRSGPGQLQVLSHVQEAFAEITVEDVRLFRDGQGKNRMLYNRWKGGNPAMRGFKSMQRRSMHTSEVIVDPVTFAITVSNERELVYVKQGQDEKNWVPWEGTSLMTYPQHPTFTPHVVLNWTTYDLPRDQWDIKMQSPVPFMDKFRNATGGWIRFSGGTPAIKLSKDRFLSVGHVVGDLGCFHKPVLTPGHRSLRAGPFRTAERIQVAPHACDASNPAPLNHTEWAAHFTSVGHTLPHHHPYYDYFFFFYTWSTRKPYRITHMSHAFITHDADDHTGVFFPSGLQPLHQPGDNGTASKFLLTYGKDDNRAMAMTFSRALLEEYLHPISSLQPHQYKFCSIGRGTPVVKTELDYS